MSTEEGETMERAFDALDEKICDLAERLRVAEADAAEMRRQRGVLAAAIVSLRDWCEGRNRAAMRERDAVDPNAGGPLAKRRARFDAQAQAYRTVRDHVQDSLSGIGGDLDTP